ncbi:MAG: zinc metalloprotease HtpX [Synechococcales bacterium]|nr:zinc metalloprotease HtpX [Synechococcales bacterium]
MSVQGLQAAMGAMKQRRFAEAISRLEAFCQETEASRSKDFFQAQMYLVKAYQENGQLAQAIALGQTMASCGIPTVEQWAARILLTLPPLPETLPTESIAASTADPSAAANVQENPNAASSGGTSARPARSGGQLSDDLSSGMTGGLRRGRAPGSGHRQPSQTTANSLAKAGRVMGGGVSVSMKGIATNLSLAAGTTLFLLVGMIFAVIMGLLFIEGSSNPTQGFAIAAALTIVFNLLVFFISPFIMDLIQSWVYATRWTDLYEIQRQSPETGRVVQEVCRKYNISTPKLGIIEDDNPTAFTYGSLPNSARLIVSRGLFKYLDEDEVAAVYAHELGHIVHWDFAVMTLAATLVQITYLLYVYARELTQKMGNSDIEKNIKNGSQAVVWMAYLFYLAGEYLVLYLSRVREYHADHFAAEVTGNPNGLSRALVKIAYGILEQGQRQEQPSKVLQGTRALGIADPRSVGAAGTAYRVAANPSEVGRVFLWDMFNPWAWWIELNSTHPLTGKRVRALSTYAEQLGLEVEFNMAQVIREGKLLNKNRLYGNFFIDLLTMQSQWIAVMIAGGLGGAIALLTKNFVAPVSIMLVLFGIATLAKLLAMYPDFHRTPEMDMLSLMSDPYASPLRGRPVRLAGEIIGRGNSGYKFSSELQFQDQTGMVFVQYTSRFGPLGNFLFGWTQAESFVHQPVNLVGWFRRGMAGYLDLAQMKCPTKWDVSSYPRFWMTIQGAAAIALGFVLPIVIRL